MKRYHTNFFGKSGECNIKEGGKCPFGSEDDHYPTIEEAQEAYEKLKADETLVSLSKPKPKEVDYSLPFYDGGDTISSSMALDSDDVFGELSEEQLDYVNLQNMHRLLNVENAPLPFLVEDHSDDFFEGHMNVRFGDDVFGTEIKINTMKLTNMSEVREELINTMKNLQVSKSLTESRVEFGSEGRNAFEELEKAAEETAKIRVYGEYLENLRNPSYTLRDWHEELEDTGSNEPNMEYIQSIESHSPIDNSTEYDDEVQFDLLADYELDYGSKSYGDEYSAVLEGPNGTTIEFDTSEIHDARDFRMQAIAALKNFDPEEFFKLRLSIDFWGDEDSDSIVEGKKNILQDRDFFLGTAASMKKDIESQ